MVLFYSHNIRIVEFGNKLAEQIFNAIFGDEIGKIEMDKFIMKYKIPTKSVWDFILKNQ